MWYNLLATADKFREVSVGEAALLALLGYAIVFLGIAFLIFVVWAVGKMMSKTGKKTVKTTSQPTVCKEEEISEETMAVIAAAIAAYYQKNNPKCEFTVKRIRRM